MRRSSFLVNLQACRLIASNFTIKWTHSQVFFDCILNPSCSTMYWLKPPHQVLKSPAPSVFWTPVGNPATTIPKKGTCNSNGNSIRPLWFLPTIPTLPPYYLSKRPNLTTLPPFPTSQPHQLPTFLTFSTSLTTFLPFPHSQTHHPPIYN